MNKLLNNIREVVLKLNRLKYCGYDIHPAAKISLGVRIDKSYPKGIHIGEETYVARGAYIFSHDYCRALHTDTFIGRRCFIGANAIILPGVKLGDNTIVGAGAVVTKSFEGGVILAGNPAKIVRKGITTKKYGMIQQNIDER